MLHGHVRMRKKVQDTALQASLAAYGTTHGGADILPQSMEYRARTEVHAGAGGCPRRIYSVCRACCCELTQPLFPHQFFSLPHQKGAAG